MNTKIIDGPIYNICDDGKIHRKDSIASTSFFWKEKTPHWQVYGDGTASMHVEVAMFGVGEGEAKDKCWMQINAAEHGEKSTKRTHVNLNKQQIERLRDLANMALGEQGEGYNGIAHDLETMRTALTLIATSNRFKGGTAVKELQGIAKSALGIKS